MGFPWYRERGGGSLLEISTKFPPPLETSTKLPPPPQNFHQTSTPLKTHKTMCFTIENACAVVHTMETSTPPVETSTKLPGGWKFGGSFHGGWKFDGNFHQISTPLETSTKLPPPPWKFGGSVQGVVEVFIVCTTAQAFSIVKHRIL